jgi:hypothetical protein
VQPTERSIALLCVIGRQLAATAGWHVGLVVMLTVVDKLTVLISEEFYQVVLANKPIQCMCHRDLYQRVDRILRSTVQSVTELQTGQATDFSHYYMELILPVKIQLWADNLPRV